METTLVSVIIPVYNVKLFLSEAIESVINQTYSNLEIILVDDGSTDGSGEICDAFAEKDSRIRVIHQENKGLSGARNAGLDIMAGEIVAFLDSDDAYYPEMIQSMVEVMLREDADAVMCQFESCYTQGKMLPKHCKRDCANPAVHDRKGALQALVEEKIDWHAWNKVYRRDCLNSVRYPQGKVYEDIETTYHILDKAHKVAVMNEPLILYRRRKGSITEKYTINSAQDRIHAYAKIEKLVEDGIPETYDETHKQCICRKEMSVLLNTYARCGKDAKSYKSDILELGKKLNLKKCDIQTKAFYYLFRISPGLFKGIYLTLLYGKRGFGGIVEKIRAIGRKR